IAFFDGDLWDCRDVHVKSSRHCGNCWRLVRTRSINGYSVAVTRLLPRQLLRFRDRGFKGEARDLWALDCACRHRRRVRRVRIHFCAGLSRWSPEVRRAEMVQTKNSDTKSQDSKVAFGVEALIDVLRNEGVGSGRAEAEKIVKDARAEAETILSKAQGEADQIVSRARIEAANLERAVRQALEVAARDTALDLKNRLSQRAAREVKHLVGEEVQREEILEKLILEVAGQGRG